MSYRPYERKGDRENGLLVLFTLLLISLIVIAAIVGVFFIRGLADQNQIPAPQLPNSTDPLSAKNDTNSTISSASSDVRTTSLTNQNQSSANSSTAISTSSDQTLARGISGFFRNELVRSFGDYSNSMDSTGCT